MGEPGYGGAPLTALCGQSAGGLASGGHGAGGLGRGPPASAGCDRLTGGRDELTGASAGAGGPPCLSGAGLPGGEVVVSPRGGAGGAGGVNPAPVGPPRPGLAGAAAHRRAGRPGLGHESGPARSQCPAGVVCPGPGPAAGPRPGRGPRASERGGGTSPWQPLAGARPGVQESGLARLLGRGAGAAGRGPAGAARAHWAAGPGHLVGTAAGGRGRLQGPQGQRLAGAAPSCPAPRPGQPALAGHGAGDGLEEPLRDPRRPRAGAAARTDPRPPPAVPWPPTGLALLLALARLGASRARRFALRPPPLTQNCRAMSPLGERARERGNFEISSIVSTL